MNPEMMSLLQGGAQAGPPPGHPPSITIGGGGSEEKPIEILTRMIDDAKAYMSVEPDEEDKATMAQLLAKLQGYLAKDQKDREAALGNPSVTRQLRKLG